MTRNRDALRPRFSLTLLALIFLLSAFQLALGERRERVVDTWRPLDYDVQLTLDDQLAEITRARTKISIYVLKGPLSVIDLDFGAMPVDSVLVGDRAARFERGADRLLVTLPKAANKDERLEIIVTYHGRPADGLILTKDKAGRPSATGDNWPDRVHHWIPCLDHPSAKATVRFTVTAPRRVLVVANGQLKDKRENADKTLTWVYTESKPIPAYCMIIAAGEFALVEPPGRAPAPLLYYVPQPDRDYALKGFGAAPPSLEFFSERVAPYPYEKLALIVAATRFGGMENSSAIVFPGTLFNERVAQSMSKRFGIRRSLVEVTAHEIAHQWFGDSVTESTWADLWLSEGFATYFAGLFIEQAEGRAEFLDYMRQQAATYLVFERERRIPLHDTETPELFSLLNGNNYQKGAWVLHMLRGILGDTVFMRGIRAYYDAHKEGNASTEDLREAMEKASGQDLKEFFRRWVYAGGHPRYEAAWYWKQAGESGGTLYITLKQMQRDEPFLTPLTVELTMPDSTPRRELMRPTGREFVASFNLPRRPVEVRIDPDEFLLKELSLREAR
ncbi:MAG TPA: M1 family metallopeptidase [Pyrinomonadaceae bacterium]|nr:M1 family metallopeptidase [Pyrinomonadaceae bacterium]